MSFIKVERNKEESGWSMPDIHSHPQYELYFLESGERSFYIDGILYLIKENTAVLVPPYVMHKTEGGPFSRVNVDFSDDVFGGQEKKILEELSKISVFPLSDKDGAAFKQILEIILSTEDSSNKSDKTAVELCVKALIGFLYMLRGNVSEVEKVSGKGCISPQTLNIIKFIKENFREKLTICTISEKFNMSESCLSKLFRRETGCNVGEFILNARLNEAKHLLGETRLSVNEIAEELGFSSANYFGLIFKQKVGVSPLGYKRWLKT